MTQQPTKNSLWSPLKGRTFRLLLASDAISSVGDWLYNIVFLVFVWDRTHSTMWVAAASILRILPEILFSVLGGVMADRYERRRVMVASFALRAVSMFALAVVAASHAPLALALALAFCSTALGTPYLPTVLALMPSTVPEDQLPAANALLSSSAYAAIALGPALGGVLVLVSSPTLVFAINGLTFLVGGLLLRRLRVQPMALEQVISVRERVVEGFRAVFSSGDVAALVMLAPIISFVPGNSFVLLVLVSERLIGTGSEGTTWLFAAIGVGGVAGTWGANRLIDRVRPSLALVSATVGIGGSFGALAFVGEPAVAYVLMVFLGISVMVIEVVSITLIQRLVPEEVAGRVFGIDTTLIYTAILLGSVVASVVAANWGLRTALVVGGGVSVTLVLLLTPKLLALDRVASQRLVSLQPRLEMLRRTTIFGAASPAVLETLSARMREEQFSPGTVVVRQGESARDFFIVASGVLTVLSSGESGDGETTVNRLEEGDYFGEIGLLEKMARTATVEAETECVLYRIDGQAFLDAVTQAPAISGALLGGVMTRLARTHPSYRPTTPPT